MARERKRVTLLSLVMRVSTMNVHTLNQEHRTKLSINRSEIHTRHNSPMNMGNPDQLDIEVCKGIFNSPPPLGGGLCSLDP